MAVFVTTFRTEGLSECLRDIDKYNARCRLAVEGALRRGTKRVARGARRRVPSKSGNLKRSITSSFKTTTLVGYARAKQPHAHLVEFGAKPVDNVRPKKAKYLQIPTDDLTRYKGDKKYLYLKKVDIPKRKAKPFMLPAFNDEKDNIVADVKKGLQNA